MKNQTASQRPTREEFEYLVERANRGDHEARVSLRRLLVDNQNIACEVADLARRNETLLIRLIADQDMLLAESLPHKLENLRRELRGDTRPEPPEKLLIDDIALKWLDVQFTRMAHSQPHEKRADAKFWEQRYERANQRYLAAIEQLAKVHKLLHEDAPA